MTNQPVPERSLGWLKQPEDPRDYQLFSFRPDIAMGAVALPASVDLRGSNQPPIGNQGSLGSCVAWACVRAYRFAHRKRGLPDYDGSELFDYWNARSYRGWTNEDTGSYLRDGIKALAEFGNAEDARWPYDISRFRDRPAPAAYVSGEAHQATRYIAVPNDAQQIKAVIASGYPVVFGIVIFQSFPMGNGVANIPMPQGQVVGGHAMTYVGYDDARQAYLVANSWGESWGDRGYAWLPYAYNAQQASDHWFIEMVEGEPPAPPPPPPPAKRLDGIGAFIAGRGIVHLWPPAPTAEECLGIGVHYSDGSGESVWP